MRVLSKDKLYDEDFKIADELISSFCKRFELLYGKTYLTYKIHALLHLPNQCRRHGPLHKTTCYPFEGFFKVNKNIVHGTTGFVNQLNNNLVTERTLRTQVTSELSRIDNHVFKHFSQSLISRATNNQTTQLIKPQQILIRNLKLEAVRLLNGRWPALEQIDCSGKILHNKIGK